MLFFPSQTFLVFIICFTHSSICLGLDAVLEPGSLVYQCYKGLPTQQRIVALPRLVTDLGQDLSGLRTAYSAKLKVNLQRARKISRLYHGAAQQAMGQQEAAYFCFPQPRGPMAARIMNNLAKAQAALDAVTPDFLRERAEVLQSMVTKVVENEDSNTIGLLLDENTVHKEERKWIQGHLTRVLDNYGWLQPPTLGVATVRKGEDFIVSWYEARISAKKGIKN